MRLAILKDRIGNTWSRTCEARHQKFLFLAIQIVYVVCICVVCGVCIVCGVWYVVCCVIICAGKDVKRFYFTLFISRNMSLFLFVFLFTVFVFSSYIYIVIIIVQVAVAVAGIMLSWSISKVHSYISWAESRYIGFGVRVTVLFSSLFVCSVVCLFVCFFLLFLCTLHIFILVCHIPQMLFLHLILTSELTPCRFLTRTRWRTWPCGSF